MRLPVPPLRQYMAPRVGLEPTAYRLTAGCSTIELPWNIIGGDIQIRTGDQGVAVHCLTTWLCRLIKYYLGWIKRFELSISRATIWRFNQLSYTHHNGRGEGTRTPGPMVPNHVRYQTALHLVLWRRRRDSNPRTSLIQPNPLAGDPLEPLEYFSKICKWRRGWDSNPRCLTTSLVFKTSSLNHSDTSPKNDLSEIRTRDTLIKSQVLYRLS